MVEKAVLEHQLSEAQAELRRHHRDFEDISAVATLVRHERMSAEDGMSIIQNIVG